MNTKNNNEMTSCITDHGIVGKNITIAEFMSVATIVAMVTFVSDFPMWIATNKSGVLSDGGHPPSYLSIKGVAAYTVLRLILVGLGSALLFVILHNTQSWTQGFRNGLPAGTSKVCPGGCFWSP